MTIFNSLGSNYDLATAARVLFSFGENSARAALRSYLQQRYDGKALLTYKGRDALMLALNALPQKGQIVVNGYTCLAVDEAVRESGHVPLYLDIAESALDFSPDTLRAALAHEPNIKAVIVQNTLGFPCDIAGIEQLCKEHSVPLIEDLAHSIGVQYPNGREAGTIGDFVILSFSQDKVVDAVSGGAVIVRNKIFSVREPSEQVPLSQQWKDRLYPSLTWKIRMSYALGFGRLYHALIRMTGILSSPFGKKYVPRALPSWYCTNILRSYRQLPKTAAHRKKIADVYAGGVPKSVHSPTAGASNLRFPILVERRDELIARLRTKGIHVSDIWYDAPVAPKKYQERSSYKQGACPNAERVAALMLNLPTHSNVSEAQAKRIAREVSDFLKQ